MRSVTTVVPIVLGLHVSIASSKIHENGNGLLRPSTLRMDKYQHVILFTKILLIGKSKTVCENRDPIFVDLNIFM